MQGFLRVACLLTVGHLVSADEHSSFFRLQGAHASSIQSMTHTGVVSWTNESLGGRFEIEHLSTKVLDAPSNTWFPINYGTVTAQTMSAQLPVPLAPSSPFGLTAPNLRWRGVGFEMRTNQCLLMKNAGVRFTRFDVDWSCTQPTSNTWLFNEVDGMIDESVRAGLIPVPILAYNHLWWVSPAWQYTNEWRNFVSTIVTRYKHKVKYWSVWNEPDLDPTDGADKYLIIFRITYETIKSIDPDAKVVLAGINGFKHSPLPYIESLYQLGVKDYFDIMDVHPYCFPFSPETSHLYNQLLMLRNLMSQYGDSNKPIWITELGWPTSRNPLVDPDGGVLRQVIRAGLSWLDPERSNWNFAVYSDPFNLSSFPYISDETLKTFTPGTCAIHHLHFDHLAALNPSNQHVVFMPPFDLVPTGAFGHLKNYVRDGGILILSGSFPLWGEPSHDPNRPWDFVALDDSYRQQLHVAYDAWWFGTGAPRETTNWYVPESFTNQIALPFAHWTVSRYLSTNYLEENDRMTNLLMAYDDTYTGVCAAAYRFNSDLRGGLIASTFGPGFGFVQGVTTNLQAAYLPRSILICLQAGIDVVFWHECRSPDLEPYNVESHYGIMYSDLRPKPAYYAYQALTRAYPPGSRMLSANTFTSTPVMVSWKRGEDNRTAWALWNVGSHTTLPCHVTGPIDDAFTHLGLPLAITVSNDVANLELSDGPIYIIGPTQLQFPP